jgi:hypothetical protein
MERAGRLLRAAEPPTKSTTKTSKRVRVTTTSGQMAPAYRFPVGAKTSIGEDMKTDEGDPQPAYRDFWSLSPLQASLLPIVSISTLNPRAQ